MPSSRRCTKRRVVPAPGPIDDGTDRIDYDLRLIDSHNMAGLLGNNLATNIRKRRLIALQTLPCRIGATRTRDDHDGNSEAAAGSPDF